jgi:hypothetical protein
MAFNGSGVFVRVHDWTTDLGNAVPVTASRADAEDDGFATGLSATICRDGQSTTTGRIPFAAGLSAAAGTTASVSYAQTNDTNTGIYFPAADQVGLVAGGTEIVTITASGISITGTLTPSGQIVAVAGTVGAPGISFASDLDCGLYRIGANNIGVAVNGAKVLDVGTAGLGITGTLSATSDVAINTDKFTVTASSGNTLVAGTLAVTGAATLSSTLAAGNTTITGTLAASGNVDINTNKFNITAASGNTAIAGTLAVTGASALTGAVTANNSAGVAARNTIKAFGTVINGALQAGSFGVTSVAAVGGGNNSDAVTLSITLANTNYAVIVSTDGENAASDKIVSYGTKTTTSFRVNGATNASGNQAPDSYSFMVLSNE